MIVWIFLWESCTRIRVCACPCTTYKFFLHNH